MSAAVFRAVSPGGAELLATERGAVLKVSGTWTLAHHAALSAQVKAFDGRLDGSTRVELDALDALDTAGARLLHALLGAERVAALLADDSALPRERRALLKAVADALAEPPVAAASADGNALGDVLADVGEAMVVFWRHLAGLTGFIGLGHVASRFGERLLAFHHRRVGLLAQFLDHACGDFRHASS